MRAENIYTSMLEKPAIQDDDIIRCLRDAYGVHAAQVMFLPLGADVNTAVYHAAGHNKTSYFAKLRRGVFDEMSVTLPKFLSEHGITQIIAPLATMQGQLWANMDAFTVILYPFVAGRNGYEIALSGDQWRDFGEALRRLHRTQLHPALMRLLPRETFSPQGRERVKQFLAHLPQYRCGDHVAAKLVAFLEAKHDLLLNLIGRADKLGQALLTHPPEFVVCHSDIHAGNLLIDLDGHLYIVDWDNPILAPKERDLMFIGGGQGFVGHTAQEEEALFYPGYGQTEVDPRALAYYRYERIVQDIAEFCAQLLLTDEGGDDREQALRYVMANFMPGGTIEIAYAADKTEGKP